MTPPSGRRAGLIDQRDRGRKRRQDVNDQTPPRAVREDAGYADALEQWLPTFIESLDLERDPVALRSFSFKNYLQESAVFGMPVDDRLRFLAMHIAYEVYEDGVDYHDRWRAADRLYKEAIRIDPEYFGHRSSRALTALHLADLVDDRQTKILVTIARQEAVAAVGLEPSAHTFSVAGDSYYQDDVVEALEFYRRALELDPGAAWPSLRFAHCLHDLERWAEAVDAYRQVPKEKFTGHRAWRIDRLPEEVADCLRRSGRAGEARRAFEEILDRYEKVPYIAGRTGMHYLRQAVEEWPDFLPRIEAIEQRW